MKKIFVALCMVAFLAACDDSSSASAGQNDELGMETSSSAELGSSSSEKAESSSSVTQGDVRKSSSSEKSGKSSSSVIETSSSSEKLESSSSVETPKSSSSELIEFSSSSADEIESSSSGSDVPQSYAEAKVMPSGTYDCTKYKCVTTEYLNQEFLEAGKYGEILDERDGLVYKTVKIGEQTWMAQNLNYAYTSVSYIYKGEIIDSSSWCYDNDFADCTKYGRLYTWAAAMGKSEDECGFDQDCNLGTGNVQGVCPDGWHVPTMFEWETLSIAVGGRNVAGAKLKATTLWDAKDGITYEDAYGFAALPVGTRSYKGVFSGVGFDTQFWSATQYEEISAYDHFYNNDYACLATSSKYYGFSVRCVKD